MASLSNGAITITTSITEFTDANGPIWRWEMDFPPIAFTITAPASGAYAFVIQNAYGAAVPLQSVFSDQGGASIWRIAGDAQFHYVFSWLQGAAGHDVTGRDATLFANDNNPNLNIGDTVLFGTGNDPFTLEAGNTQWGLTRPQPTLFQSGTYEMFMTDGNGNRISTNGVVILPTSLIAAASRKAHGAVAFDIALPLTGEAGVECRSSAGNHTLMFVFSNNIVSGNASVTTGTGSVSGSPTFAGPVMTVNLTGVTDVQKITVTLSGVTASLGQVVPDTAVSVNMLVGDVTGNKTVNSSDVSQTKLQSGQAVTLANFREDVNVNGQINGTDVSLVKLRVGSGLP